MSEKIAVSSRADETPPSGIVAVVKHGRGREGLIPLWSGEGDLPTPAFIGEATTRALEAGETFYTWQRGVPELREALSRYYARLYAEPVPAERVFVVGSGMQAIKLSIDLVTSPGDEVVYLTPAWPNFPAAAGVSGARTKAVPLTEENGAFSLDADRLAASIGPHTRAIFVNTPANPTGWTASREDLDALLELARKHGLWIIADEIYARYYYGEGERAPSFLDVAHAEDRILYVNSFSKNWSMTGWRIGWIVAPEAVGQQLENLIQYSTSGVAPFLQRGAVAAVEEGEAVVRENIARAAHGRDVLCEALLATNRVAMAKPAGAFYAFFAVDGITDTMAVAKDIIDRAGVGLSPGVAFGPGGERFLRACFLRDPRQMKTAAERLADYFSAL
ncbi:pyridoxal phosphate-dependent aminotransferase [Pararhizobium mangrovi]|uniref:Aminotransferase n=1 Tax=Pararhizobium mangrovi TaxID=2590452 RepID=A0A506TYF1_9HYPH|nr:pyridoxal phosphate-dependent aminotransferase [Pararhizobium mangrovi]TPW25744.1 pyridoxal phosphate-dependent aminotransferase [Pararhizobium mangrovi]